jgi:DNA-binding transcriptional regulator YdaS (Cro superfamily)
VILAAGLPLAFAAGRTLNAVLPPAGRRVERLRGQVASWLLAGLVSLLALDQLRLAAQLTLAVTVAGVAACALALALAFGLGCRDLARDLIVEYLRAGSETGEAARR